MTIISHHWNRVVRRDDDQSPKDARMHVRASELGMPMIDRYLKMKGEPPSNPFSDRVLRIFDAGKAIEFITFRALAMAGILNSTQKWVELPEGSDHLKITGYLDAVIGGVTDWDEAQARTLRHLEDYKLSLDDALLEQKAISIIEGMRREHPNGIPEQMVVEVKSINSMSFHAHRNRSVTGHFEGYFHNKLQLYAYLHMTGLKSGLLLYVSKDDFTLEEVPVRYGDPELEEAFWKDLREITGYVRDGVMPDPEPAIVYNDRKRVFEANFAVARSPYLTRVYGFADASAFERHFHQELLDRNRVLKHIREGKVTDKDRFFIEMYGLESYA